MQSRCSSVNGSSRPIAFFGDWHGHLGWSLGCIDAAEKAGVRTMVSVGDCALDWPGARRGRYEKRINEILAQKSMRLLISPGNHDNWDTILKLQTEGDGLARWRSRIWVLPRGGRTVCEGLMIGGLGGAFSIDSKRRTEGKDWWPDEEPTYEEAQRLIEGGPVDVLVTHDAPLSVPLKSHLKLSADLIMRANQTRTLIDDVVAKLTPAHLIAGHWHQRKIHEILHPGGEVTRVDILANEMHNLGNAILVHPSRERLKVETLKITSR
ncbi:hypothetical protein GC088_10040 [Arthrobacter sp. JZ12]|uniref:metallophosphoesterase family protein n=1 Tax=Arthrobacter sp. JZ12 TaxID=2654190 RepID=UPI00308F2870|nr:hypothetical protein GC088_10040 [Arthrobacter sp. JZ12]